MISTLQLLPLEDLWRTSFDNFYRDMSSLAKVDPSGTAQYEEDGRMVYEFNMAGFKKNDIEVKLLRDEKLLKVKGSRASYPNRKYLYNSLSSKDKVLTIGLLEYKDLDINSAQVEFVDGILRVSFSKVDPTEHKSQSELALDIT